MLWITVRKQEKLKRGELATIRNASQNTGHVLDM